MIEIVFFVPAGVFGGHIAVILFCIKIVVTILIGKQSLPLWLKPQTDSIERYIRQQMPPPLSKDSGLKYRLVYLLNGD